MQGRRNTAEITNTVLDFQGRQDYVGTAYSLDIAREPIKQQYPLTIILEWNLHKSSLVSSKSGCENDQHRCCKVQGKDGPTPASKSHQAARPNGVVAGCKTRTPEASSHIDLSWLWAVFPPEMGELSVNEAILLLLQDRSSKQCLEGWCDTSWRCPAAHGWACS